MAGVNLSGGVLGVGRYDPTATLLGNRPSVGLDEQMDLSALARQKALVQAILQASMSNYPQLIDAGAVKVPNWGDALGDIAQQIGAMKSMSNLSDQERAIAEQQQATRAKGVQQFEQDMSSAGYQPQGPSPADSGPMPADGSEPPPQSSLPAVTDKEAMSRALSNLMLSRDPMLMGIGTKGAEGEITNEQAIEKELAIPKTVESNGVLTALQQNRGAAPTVLSQTPLVQYGPYQPAGPGTAAGQYQVGTNKFETSNAPLGAPDQMGTQFLEKQAESLRDRADKTYGILSAPDLPVRLQGLKAGIDFLDSGQAVTGAKWSDLSLDVQKGLSALGIAPDRNGVIPSTEAVMTALRSNANAILATLKPVNGADVNIAYRAVGGLPENDPRYAAYLARGAIAVAQNTADLHQKNLNDIQDILQQSGINDRLRAGLASAVTSFKLPEGWDIPQVSGVIQQGGQGQPQPKGAQTSGIDPRVLAVAKEIDTQEQDPYHGYTADPRATAQLSDYMKQEQARALAQVASNAVPGRGPYYPDPNLLKQPPAGVKAGPIPVVKTDEDYNKVEPGTNYIAPDGTVKTKRKVQ